LGDNIVRPPFISRNRHAVRIDDVDGSVDDRSRGPTSLRRWVRGVRPCSGRNNALGPHQRGTDANHEQDSSMSSNQNPTHPCFPNSLNTGVIFTAIVHELLPGIIPGAPANWSGKSTPSLPAPPTPRAPKAANTNSRTTHTSDHSVLPPTPSSTIQPLASTP
jgi:hypothetical protein